MSRMTYMRSWKSHRLTSHTWLGFNPQIGRPLSRIVGDIGFFFLFFITTPCLVFFPARQVPEIIFNKSSKSTENALIEWLVYLLAEKKLRLACRKKMTCFLLGCVIIGLIIFIFNSNSRFFVCPSFLRMASVLPLGRLPYSSKNLVKYKQQWIILKSASEWNYNLNFFSIKKITMGRF
jgi:hypothetical protein